MDDNEYQAFVLKFQRDLNRISDTDRMTRKRGLQNLLDALPWNNKTDYPYLINFIKSSLIELLLITLTDAIEKCRELTLKILMKIFELNSTSATTAILQRNGMCIQSNHYVKLI